MAKLDKVQVVSVVFVNGVNVPVQVKEYVYKCPYAVTVDDLVVVSSSTGFGLAKVIRIIEDDYGNAELIKRATKWVVDVVDLTDHNDRIDKANRLLYVKNKLEEKKKQLEEVAIFEMLAKVDPDSAKLLEELKVLTLEATTV